MVLLLTVLCLSDNPFMQRFYNFTIYLFFKLADIHCWNISIISEVNLSFGNSLWLLTCWKPFEWLFLSVVPRGNGGGPVVRLRWRAIPPPSPPTPPPSPPSSPFSIRTRRPAISVQCPRHARRLLTRPSLPARRHEARRPLLFLLRGLREGGWIWAWEDPQPPPAIVSRHFSSYSHPWRTRWVSLWALLLTLLPTISSIPSFFPSVCVWSSSYLSSSFTPSTSSLFCYLCSFPPFHCCSPYLSCLPPSLPASSFSSLSSCFTSSTLFSFILTFTFSVFLLSFLTSTIPLLSCLTPPSPPPPMSSLSFPFIISSPLLPFYFWSTSFTSSFLPPLSLSSSFWPQLFLFFALVFFCTLLFVFRLHSLHPSFFVPVLLLLLLTHLFLNIILLFLQPQPTTPSQSYHLSPLPSPPSST